MGSSALRKFDPMLPRMHAGEVRKGADSLGPKPLVAPLVMKRPGFELKPELGEVGSEEAGP